MFLTISDFWKVKAFKKNILWSNYYWISPAHCIYFCLGTCGHGKYVRVESVNGYNIIYYRGVLLLSFTESCGYFSYTYLYFFQQIISKQIIPVRYILFLYIKLPCTNHRRKESRLLIDGRDWWERSIFPSIIPKGCFYFCMLW